jgi:ketosteroid isomerase-like protein
MDPFVRFEGPRLEVEGQPFEVRDLACRRAPQRLLKQISARRKVMGNRPERDAGFLRDGAVRNRLKAPLADDLKRRAEDPLIGIPYRSDLYSHGGLQNNRSGIQIICTNGSEVLSLEVVRLSQKTLETIYDAFGRGDMETVGAAYADDIEWRVNGPSPVSGTYDGKDAVFGFFSRMMDQYEGTLKVEVTAMVADDDAGFVAVQESASRPDAVNYSGIHAWRFRDGKCAEFESYYDDTYYDFWAAHTG